MRFASKIAAFGAVALGLLAHPDVAEAAWVQVGGCARSIANNAGQVAVVGCGTWDTMVYTWSAGPYANQGTWQQAGMWGQQVAIAADAVEYSQNGVLQPRQWVVRSDQSVWRWSWVNSRWESTGYYADAIGADSDGYGGGSNVWITGTGGGDEPIYQWIYNPSGDYGVFTPIGNGGRAASVAAFMPNSTGFLPGEVYPFVTSANGTEHGWNDYQWMDEGGHIAAITNQYCVADQRIYDWLPQQGVWGYDDSLTYWTGASCSTDSYAHITQVAYPTTPATGCAWSLDSCGNIYCDGRCCLTVR